MARIFCIVSFLILVAVPAAGAMGHAHHGNQENERAAMTSPERALPIAVACDVAERADKSMPGHGACLGCCPDRHVQGNVSPTPRVQDALSVTQRTSSSISRSIDVPVTHGARLPGLAPGDFCTVLRL